MNIISTKARLKEFLILSKARLSFMNALMPISGIYAVTGNLDYKFCLPLIIGNFCLAASSQSMGQIFEQQQDSLMKRTKNRPLIIKSISNKEATIFTVSTFVLGNTILLMNLPMSSVCISNSAFFLYYIYLKCKQITPYSIYLGAIVGVLPILSGYLAISSEHEISLKLVLDILFMFNWQISHFIGILWRNRDDYQNAGFKMHKNTFLLFSISTFFLLSQLLLFYNLNEKDNYHSFIKLLMSITIFCNVARTYYILTNSPISKNFKSIWLSHYSLAFQYYVLYSLREIKRTPINISQI